MKAKKKVVKSKSPASVVKAIRESQTKTEIIRCIAEETELSRKQVQAVFETLALKVRSHLMKNGSGEFRVPELGLKIVRKTKPATKKRIGRNPSTGEEMVINAKPKREVIKALPLKALKEVLQG